MKQRISAYCFLCVAFFLLLAVSGCKEDMKDRYQKAMKAYRAEDYEKAAELFEVILQKYPNHDLTRKARYELGNIYFYKLKQPHKALKYLQELYAQSHPGQYSMEALKLMGYIYNKSLNDCLKGVDVYRILLKDYTSDINPGEYQYAIAECYFKLHDYGQAMVEYTTLVDQYPENQYALRSKFQVANSHALQEQWEQAMTLYEELLTLDSLPAQLAVETKLELAFCYEHQELFDDALKLYQELEEIDSTQVIIDTASVARKIERVQEALKDSKKGPAKVQWQRKKK